MTKLPVIDFRTFSKILKSWGFEIVRQKGSHVIFEHGDGRTLAVPNHPGEDLNRPLLRGMLRQINVSVEDYLDALGKV